MDTPNIEIDPAVEEPPMLAFVRDYWRRQKGDRVMPGRQDILPSDMKPYLRHILLVDVVDRGKDFRYRLIGSQLHEYFAGNPTGKLMSETLKPFGADTVNRTIEMYRQVVTRRAPIRIRGSGSAFSQGSKLFDALLTPLADDGANASMIFGTFIFVWNAEAQQALSRGTRSDEAALKKALSGAAL